MKKDKLNIYLLEVVLIAVFLIALFSNRLFSNKIIISMFLLIYAIIVKLKINRSRTISIQKKEITLAMLIFAIFYVGFYYIIGYYTGYYYAIYKFSINVIFRYIIPVTLIIISTEVIRNEFFSDKSRMSRILTLITTVLIDVVTYTNIYRITNLDKLLTALGYVLFASISCNLLFNYINNRYGMKPNIIYRLITILYLYIIPITPDVFIYFQTFCRIIYPIFIYIFIDNYYGEKKKILSLKSRKIGTILTTLVTVVMVSIIMLISCKFKYGVLVVGSGSMSGAIEIGDAVVYNSHEKIKDIDIGDVIVYSKDSRYIIHRVVDKENINGEYRLYTKGDNNIQADAGYVTEDKLVGNVNIKVRKIGLPTVWLNQMFIR